MSRSNTRLILVGGFLGAGKTTLMQQAAVRLADRGRRAALLANDQAADLVDTALLRETGAAVDEVAGGCFCCRFDDMVAAIDRLKSRVRPDYIIAEPVGSCTDLSATVLQPLKRLYGQQIELALYSVLIDVTQVRVSLGLHEQVRGQGDGFPDEVLYIYRKQVEEADVIVLNKTDLVSPSELDALRSALASRFPGTPIVPLSARTGEGVDAWLDLLGQPGRVGRKIAEVNYDTYAAGEAALGWLNASAALSAGAAVDWTALARQLLDTVRAGIQEGSGHIGHLKLYLTSRGQGHVAGNIVNNGSPAAMRSSLTADVREVSLLLNARVEIHADRLREIVESSLSAVAAEHGVDAVLATMRSFFPSRPVPVHRFSDVVE